MSAHVRSVLESRLDAWAKSQSTPIPVSYEGKTFVKPSNNSPFLECYLIPNVTMNYEMSGVRSTQLGMFQVNVWIKAGTGVGKGEAIADSIVGLFPMVPKFSDVSVEQTPTVNAAIPDEAGWIITPVLVKYRYEHYG
jgi:hypothetical protein